MKFFKQTKVALAVGMMALLMVASAGCGDDNDTTSANDTAEQATAAMGSEDIVAVASGDEQFSTLVTAIKAAGLVETLQGDGPFTVFAPTNDAFDKLPEGTLEDLLKPENKDQLTSILTYHVVPGKVMAADLKDGQKVKTVQGEELTVQIDGSTVTIVGADSKAQVIAPDVEASNGVIHAINNVLLPAPE